MSDDLSRCPDCGEVMVSQDYDMHPVYCPGSTDDRIGELESKVAQLVAVILEIGEELRLQGIEINADRFLEATRDDEETG